ncbi:hypothetical protein [Spirosoma pollinicola]|uniref:Uncharacterized protein n=1 Tax=Spirosoma pollinicola TaxID=2057025 RepID=A0A2K8YTR5_9BACT|nr:hypothetical protein [Spirosoma pollinicola]AUD00958.1 hypothetical protein CWM47_03475 [Spirosoma pollinicola]
MTKRYLLMEINHDILISLGFVELSGRKTRYAYKGVTGRLSVEAGLFFFHGFNPGIGTVTDLRYMLMLIDYNHQATFVAYPSQLN